MSRLGSLAAIAALGVSALIGVAHYAAADDRAEQLAKDANKLMFSDPPQYDKAIELYQQAIVLSPEGKYYFNLCVAYYSVGEFGSALQACDAVKDAGADDTVLGKTDKVLHKVEDQLRAMGKDPDQLRRQNAGSGTGTGTGTGTGSEIGTGTGTAIGTGTGTGTGGGHGEGQGHSVGTGEVAQIRGAPPPSLFTTKPPSHDYVWSFGGELYGFGASFGAGDKYGTGGAGLRLHADYILVPKMRLGVQGYLGINSVGGGTGASAETSLSIADFGVAAYDHIFCAGHLCVTPLAGLHIGAMQPASVQTNQVQFAALGVRAELGLSYAFGPQYENVISLTPGFNIYLPSVGSYNGMQPSDFGLDKVGSAVYFGVGYTRRFDTPFGQAPFITLE